MQSHGTEIHVRLMKAQAFVHDQGSRLPAGNFVEAARALALKFPRFGAPEIQGYAHQEDSPLAVRWECPGNTPEFPQKATIEARPWPAADDPLQIMITKIVNGSGTGHHIHGQRALAHLERILTAHIPPRSEDLWPGDVFRMGSDPEKNALNLRFEREPGQSYLAHHAGSESPLFATLEARDSGNHLQYAYTGRIRLKDVPRLMRNAGMAKLHEKSPAQLNAWLQREIRQADPEQTLNPGAPTATHRIQGAPKGRHGAPAAREAAAAQRQGQGR